ncbi:GNAT family N-acetyltransferase [Lacrimispora amygdalina]|uniref:GNAT family N-acetyltransferase n=1 Tax=Lacrimispora amygdalina TaxID=253257 RepID=UPI000BE415D2|nr:GNAT family N-acetyltransferase [Lacrimispora amygdalina]
MRSNESFNMKFYNSYLKQEVICRIDEAKYNDYIEAMISSKISEPIDGFCRLSYVEIKEEDSKSILAFCVDFKNTENKISLDVYIALLETHTQRQGYGTMLFNAMLRYINQRVIASIGENAVLKSIRGELSTKDKYLGNWKKSIPFYKKLEECLDNQFQILFKDEFGNIFENELFEEQVDSGYFIFEKVES